MPKRDPLARDPLADAMYKALTGRTPRLEQASAATRVAWLEQRHGSLTAVARQTGIPRTTLRRWRDGISTPRAEREQQITRAIREQSVPKRRQDRFRKSTQRRPWAPDAPRRTGRGSNQEHRHHGGLTVTADITISSDHRQRTLNLGQNLGPEHADRIIVAFMSGDDADFRAALNAAVGAYFHTTGAAVIVSEPVTIDFSPVT
jgi:hypothetical protein